MLYHDGTGVARNLVYAYVLYAIAADKAEDSDDRKLHMREGEGEATDVPQMRARRPALAGRSDLYACDLTL